MTTDFADLLRARALRALLPAEQRALEELAATSPERAQQLAEVDAVLSAFAAEVELAAAVGAPAEPIEEHDPGLARLSATAAASEAQVRARLLHPVAARALVQNSPWRRRTGWAVLAAAAALALWFAFGQDEGPALDRRAPQDLRAGAPLQLVLLQPTLTADARTISWAAVPGASGYDAELRDAGDRVVLRRAGTSQKSTAWEITAEQFRAVQSRAPLRLRVTALDGAGIPIGSSGDLQLELR